jgi:hypothetical protein
MPMPAFINRLLKMMTPPPTGGPQAPAAPLEDWSLVAPIFVLLLPPPAALPLQYRGNRPGIQILPYPFDMPEVAGMVEQWPSPDAGQTGDGK